MSKILFAISLMSLMACGAGESDSGKAGSGSDMPAVSAAAPRGDEVDVVEVEEIAIDKGEQAKPNADAAEIRSCIDLVGSGDFEQALPVCMKAASIDAENAQVQAALAKAQAETAAKAAGETAAKAAGETAAKAAGGAASDAAENALGGLGN